MSRPFKVSFEQCLHFNNKVFRRSPEVIKRVFAYLVIMVLGVRGSRVRWWTSYCSKECDRNVSRSLEICNCLLTRKNIVHLKTFLSGELKRRYSTAGEEGLMLSCVIRDSAVALYLSTSKVVLKNKKKNLFLYSSMFKGQPLSLSRPIFEMVSR